VSFLPGAELVAPVGLDRECAGFVTRSGTNVAQPATAGASSRGVRCGMVVARSGYGGTTIDGRRGSSMTTRQGWIVWGVAVAIGAVVLPRAVRSTPVAVVVLALLAIAGLVRFWLRRRADVRDPDQR
jgi:hypothetical protein